MNPNSASSSPAEETPVASAQRIVVGVDPGLDEHGVAVLAAGTCARLERRKFPNTVAGMESLVQRLTEWRERSGGQLTIAMEEASAYGEALECYLSQAGFAAVVVCETKVAAFKKALGGDANDLLDAEAVARFVLVQPESGTSSGTAGRGGGCPRFRASSATHAVPASSPLDTGPYCRGQRVARRSAYGLVGRLSAVFQR